MGLLLAVVTTSFSRQGGKQWLASAAAASFARSNDKTANSANANTKERDFTKRSPISNHELRVIQVQIVHRHGDRTPITPLRNESYWASELVQEALLQKVASTTKILRDAEAPNNHLAGGRGPFGKLTQLGLLQMVQLGGVLREQLSATTDDDHHIDEDGNLHYNRGRLFGPCNPLQTSKIKVFSTDFPRTIQSVQGTLVGLFPDPHDVVEPIHVDVRHTSILIPDPQPRRTQEQHELEISLARRPQMQAREKDLKALAIETTQALKHLLSDDAFSVSFGVGEESNHDPDDAQPKPLSWAQLSEITKCLQVRNMLPTSITDEVQHMISQHTAWRWFENLRHPRLAYLAMNSLVTRIVEAMQHRVLQRDNDHMEAPLYLYSAHDSTLIGLLCAFSLEQPAQWPEYGSYLKLELIEAKPLNDPPTQMNICHFVRFSLNGEVLRCKWEESDDAPLGMIRLDRLAEFVATNGAYQ
jgi:Histidine phosphatase superfamily (branch 2)